MKRFAWTVAWEQFPLEQDRVQAPLGAADGGAGTRRTAPNDDHIGHSVCLQVTPEAEICVSTEAPREFSLRQFQPRQPIRE
jgi:hypothetical protein